MAVRLKDIAKDLNLSVVTVSKVLRNQTDISSETRELVLRRMRELNYQPNLAARSLATGRTYSLGLVVPSLLHPFFAEVAKGIVDVIRKKGFGLLITSSDEDDELERQEIEQLLARQVDALIVASSQVSADFFRKIKDRHSATILIDRRFPDLRTNFVGVNDVQVGLLATLHLIDRGCKRIAHIRGPEISTGIGRLEGYRQALVRRGFHVMPEMVRQSKSADSEAENDGHEAMSRLLRADPRPDGVFCFNDVVALGAIQAVLEAGLKIPGDVAIVGCGNSRWAGLLRVPLSSVDQGAAKIGERAARLALKLIESKSAPRTRTIILAPELVVRQSSAGSRLEEDEACGCVFSRCLRIDSS
jgi:LacI family transcriptional regulator